MNSKKLDEVTQSVYNRLLERFGTPIGDRPTTYGVPDERANEDKICEGCGCNEKVCECGMTESDELAEVTPKGYEKIVRSLKKSKGVENPWAVAWSMKSKGIKPKK